ncbi:hypothetical protein BCR33DRAFT_718167, partial [Rhizoclosmatium globosum]
MTSYETLVYANLTAASPYVKLSKLDSILTSLRGRREWVLMCTSSFQPPHDIVQASINA